MSGIFNYIPFASPAVVPHQLKQDTVAIGVRSVSVGIALGFLAQIAGHYTRVRAAPLFTAVVFAASSAVMFRRESNIAQAALTQRVVDVLNDDKNFEPSMMEDLKSQPELWQNLCSKLKPADFRNDPEILWELACHHHESLDISSTFFNDLTFAIYRTFHSEDKALKYRVLFKAFITDSTKLLNWLSSKGVHIEDFLTTGSLPQEITRETLQSLCQKPLKNFTHNGGSATLIKLILKLDYLSDEVYSALDSIIYHYREDGSKIIKNLFLKALEENRTTVINNLYTRKTLQGSNLTNAEVYNSWISHENDDIAKSLKSKWDVKNPDHASAHKRADEYFKERPSDEFVKEMTPTTFDAICARVRPEECTSDELMRFWTFICRLDESFILKDVRFRGFVNNLMLSKCDKHPFILETVKACRPGIVREVLNERRLDMDVLGRNPECWVAIRDAQTLTHFLSAAQLTVTKIYIPKDVLPQILTSDLPYNARFTKYDHVKGLLSSNRGAFNLEEALGLCRDNEQLTKLVQSFINAEKFLGKDPLPESYVDDTDKLTFEAILARDINLKNIDHRLIEMWTLSCKFDYLPSIHTLFIKLTLPGQNNLPTMIEIVGKYCCPDIIKNILTVRYDVFKKDLEGKFNVLIQMYKSPELLNVVIQNEEYYKPVSNAEAVIRALLDAGVEEVDKSIKKWRHQSSAQPFVKIMMEHLEKQQAAGKE